jgi:hypothetical protein
MANRCEAIAPSSCAPALGAGKGRLSILCHRGRVPPLAVFRGTMRGGISPTGGDVSFVRGPAEDEPDNHPS